MVDIVLLAASCTLELCHHRRESLREWDHKPNIFRGTKQSGLDLENKARSSGRGGAFFLTSLFIELIYLVVAVLRPEPLSKNLIHLLAHLLAT